MADCKYAVLCIDPGWKCGVALVSIDGGTPKYLYTGVIATDPANKKLRLLKADDDCRRGDEVWEGLQEVADKAERIVAVFIESATSGKGSRAVYSMGHNKSLANCFARHIGAPTFCVSAQAVKKAATGKNSASKQQVIDAMIKKAPHLDWDGIVKSKREHAADACAVFLAGWKLPELQAMMRMVDHGE